MSKKCECGDEKKECTCDERENDGCGCGHDHDEEKEHIIHLTLEDDSEIECLVIGSFGVDEKDYMALLSEDEDVFLYRYKEIGENEIDLINIEDDSEFEAVSDVFFELFVEEE